MTDAEIFDAVMKIDWKKLMMESLERAFPDAFYYGNMADYEKYGEMFLKVRCTDSPVR